MPQALALASGRVFATQRRKGYNDLYPWNTLRLYIAMNDWELFTMGDGKAATDLLQAILYSEGSALEAPARFFTPICLLGI